MIKTQSGSHPFGPYPVDDPIIKNNESVNIKRANEITKVMQEEKYSGFTQELTLVVTKDELYIVSKKTEKIGVDIADLLGEHIQKTSAFENVFIANTKPITSNAGE